MRFYEFTDFRIDSEERVLYRNGSPIALAPKVFDTLFCLVQRHGRVVSKDTLMEEIWQNTFVEENNLTQYIFTLRRILDEKKDGTKYIETVSRRGYRFVPEVSIVEIEEEVLSPAFRRLPAENYVRSDLIPQPGKKPFENRTQNLNPITDKTFDSQTKPPEGGTPNFPEGGTPNFFPQAEAQDIVDTPRRKSSSRAALLFGLIALVLIGSLGFALRSGWQAIKQSNSKEINLRRLTESGNLFGAAISSDGNSLAYVVREGKNSSIRLKNIQTESEVVVVPPTEDGLGSPRFSPDGNFIYYGGRRGIFQIPVFGGEPRLIATNIWSDFSVSPDGRQVAFPQSTKPGVSSSIVVADTDGSGERVVATRRDPDYYMGWGPAPVFSPDGEHLTVVTGRHGGRPGIVEINLQTGIERELKMPDVWETFRYIGWTNPNELLMTAQKQGENKIQIWRVKFPEGIAERVTNDFNDYLSFSLTKDAGKIVAVQETENLHLWLFDKESGAARQITSGVSRADGRFGLSFAPDGRIVFTARDKNDYAIFSVKMDGSDLRQLTKSATYGNFDAVVSPDNRFIAFISDRTGKASLWLMNSDGTGARQLTAPSKDMEITEDAPYFSSDGRWIYYVFQHSGKGSIRKISIDGGESVAVSQTDKSVFEPVPSPDGKFLAHAVYNDEAASPWQVAVQSLDDPTAPERFFDIPALRQRVRWSLDSQSIVLIDDQLGAINLWQTNLATGERKQITDFKTEKIYRFDVSPDRRFYALARGNYFYDAVLIER